MGLLYIIIGVLLIKFPGFYFFGLFLNEKVFHTQNNLILFFSC